jgi:hypothetical protein
MVVDVVDDVAKLRAKAINDIAKLGDKFMLMS